MLMRKKSRPIVAALLAAGLASYMGLQRAALSEVCLGAMFSPVHSDCELAGADSDAHIDRRECHVVPALFTESQRTVLLVVPAVVKHMTPESGTPAFFADETLSWPEPLVENFGPRAPPSLWLQA